MKDHSRIRPARAGQGSRSEASRIREKEEMAVAWAQDSVVSREESLALLHSIPGFKSCASWEEAAERREGELRELERDKFNRDNMRFRKYWKGGR